MNTAFELATLRAGAEPHVIVIVEAELVPFVGVAVMVWVPAAEETAKNWTVSDSPKITPAAGIVWAVPVSNVKPAATFEPFA